MENQKLTAPLGGILGLIGGILLLVSVPYVFLVLSIIYHVSIETVMGISSLWGLAILNILFGFLIIVFGISIRINAKKSVAILMIIFGIISAFGSFISFGGFVGIIGGILGGIGGALTIKVLKAPLKAEQDRITYDLLIAQLSHTNSDIRLNAIWKLGELGDQRAADPLIGILHDSNPSIRAAAAWSLGELSNNNVIPALITVLRDQDMSVRKYAAESLGELDPTYRGKSPEEILSMIRRR